MHLPKLGERRLSTAGATQVFVQETAAGPVFRVTYNAVLSAAYGTTPFPVVIDIDKCNNTDCTDTDDYDEATIFYDLTSDYLGLDGRFANGVDTNQWIPNLPNGEDPFRPSAEFIPGCGHPTGVGDERTGWDPNDDTGTTAPNFFNDFRIDKAFNYNLRWPTTADPRSTSANDEAFDLGDVVPWDWQLGGDQVLEIQKRLSPNRQTEIAMGPPDYRTATYLNDLPLPTDLPFHPFFRQLRHKDTDQRPLVARGFTPLGFSMSNFREWFLDFSGEAGAVIGQSPAGGDVTADPDWSCRDKFVLLLTDGQDTCSYNNDGTLKPEGIIPSAVSKALFETFDLKSYVVGFGLEADDDGTLDCASRNDQLTCMAVEGGTEAPIFPQNKDQLVEALLDIFGDVQASSRAFASASLPAVQSTAADKVFFSSFTPIPEEARWSGRVDVFREPLLAEGEPPICNRCLPDADDPDDPGRESGCHLYNVGHTILSQGPSDAQIDAPEPDGNIGTALSQRRVIYPLAYKPITADGAVAQPLPMRLLTLPDFNNPTTLDQEVRDDLEEVFVAPADQTLSDAFKEDKLKSVYRNTLRIKNSPFLADATVCPDDNADEPKPFGVPSDWEDGDYLLGDVFHANPLITSSPSDLTLLRQDLCGGVGVTGTACAEFSVGDEEDAVVRGYRHFANRSLWIRRMLGVAANDGQLHFFDTGTQREIDGRNVFTDGTGNELFSFMPRIAMPIVREQAEMDATHIFSLDGSYSIGDVVIDPLFETSPSVSEREWRTVLIGGLREGGDRLNSDVGVPGFVSGYYALDITQPDGLNLTEGDTTTIRDNLYLPDGNAGNGVLPSCMKFDDDGNQIASTLASCANESGANLPFPALKWEFTDRAFFFDGGSTDEGWYRFDEDYNGEADLADTWSQPLIGQIQVLDAGVETTRWVAIFGGGVDPVFKFSDERGNWLYMIDIETGATLYKRPVDGAVPSDIGGLDIDLDGILDALYFGTTTGTMYKVDLRTTPGNITTHTIEEFDADGDGTDDSPILDWPDSSRSITVDRITNVEWDPLAIFDTEDRPIFLPPALVFIPELGRHAVAFGTGDREKLWELNGDTGRFYFIVDQDDFVFGNPDLPHTEDDFTTFNFDAPLVGVDSEGLSIANPPNFVTGEDLTSAPAGLVLGDELGWIMRFPEETRVTTRPFVLAGVVVFTAFQPDIDALVDGGQTLCRRTGISRSLVVDARNGDALSTLKDFRDPDLDRLGDGSGLVGGGGTFGGPGDPSPKGDCGDRCIERTGFGTSPFVTSGATKNPPSEQQVLPGSDPLDDPVVRRLIERIKQIGFPSGCLFNDRFHHMIKMQLDDTKTVNLAPIPIRDLPSGLV